MAERSNMRRSWGRGGDAAIARPPSCPKYLTISTKFTSLRITDPQHEWDLRELRKKESRPQELNTALYVGCDLCHLSSSNIKKKS